MHYHTFRSHSARNLANKPPSAPRSPWPARPAPPARPAATTATAGPRRRPPCRARGRSAPLRHRHRPRSAPPRRRHHFRLPHGRRRAVSAPVPARRGAVAAAGGSGPWGGPGVGAGAACESRLKQTWCLLHARSGVFSSRKHNRG